MSKDDRGVRIWGIVRCSGGGALSVPASPGHLKVNCPTGAREATLGCPIGGGKGGRKTPALGGELENVVEDDTATVNFQLSTVN